MLKYKELIEKRNYLNLLRQFTPEEQENIKKNIIFGNTRNKDSNVNSYTLEEKTICIEQLKIPRTPDCFFYEIIGQLYAYNYIKTIVNDEKTKFHKFTLDEQEVKHFNRLILQGDYMYDIRGIYRCYMAKVGRTALPHGEEIKKLMEELIINWNKKSNDNLVYRISMFHLKFEEIHPFSDGNGRTGRALLNLELARNGFPLINIKYNNLDKYYNSFNEYRTDGTNEVLSELIYQELDRELSNHIIMKEKSIKI